jgi:hypothetical protein
MSKHVKSWLPAYHDGELKGAQLAQVQAHLAECEECRLELEVLAGLSALLQEAHPAKAPTPTTQFAAQVALRMPRRPQEPTWRKALRWGWQLAPSGIGLAWAFAITTSTVSNLIAGTELLLGDPLFSDKLAGLQPQNTWGLSFAPLLEGVEGAAGLLWDALGLGGSLSFDLTFSLLIPLALGLLALSWTAAWWLTQTNGKSNGHVDGRTE